MFILYPMLIVMEKKHVISFSDLDDYSEYVCLLTRKYYV